MEEIIQHVDNDWQMAESATANSTLKSLEDFTMDSNFARLLCSLVLVIVWVTYITYYHSRVLGYILTRIINRNMFLKQGYFHVGKVLDNLQCEYYFSVTQITHSLLLP